MRCRKANKLISSSIDGSLDSRSAAALEKHLAACPACREFAADLNAVVETASRLERPEPSEAAWNRIRSGIKQSAAVSPAPETPRFRPWTLGWRSPAVRAAGVAFVGLVLVAGGVFLGVRMKRDGAAMSPGDRADYTLAKLDEAEGYYLKAIESLSEAFTSQQGALIPEVAEMFARNLEVIDVSIQACRRAVLAEPEDLQARSYLLAAYMEKVSFLNSALEFPEKSPAVLDGGRVY
jgi:tetratricopeptide (TPR) repeat protein